MIAKIPFNSEIKFNLCIRDMSTLETHDESKKGLWVIMKGAPDRIIDRCSKILIKGEEVPLTDKYIELVNEQNVYFAGLGERVLAFAKISLDPREYDPKSFIPDMKKWSTWPENKPKAERKPEDFANFVKPAGWFPMTGLTLVGLVSLNDPPRKRVDHSVDMCRQAGIKVIMVTGDQPATAAAIAHKVRIINDLEKVHIVSDYDKEHKKWEEEHGLTPQQCEKNAKAVVVHGDKLAAKHLAEDTWDDLDPEKGRYLLDWISKPEVVFARTTPSQKLLIVAACQKAGHVVAVTGDGVNDSPAIKKADIGIAMGSGSDVAQNAADMLLLDDDFSSIVNGVLEGRLIFDNLKKSIAYTLSSNIPEISPFIAFIILQVPLPLSTVLILCIDLGTDMVPAISFAYENPELDIMSREPRNSKRDHLVNAKLISFAYLQIGMIQAAAGFFTYFYILSDYGFRPSTLFFISNIKGFKPGHDDVYNASAENRGNSNYDVAGVRDDKDIYFSLNWDSARDMAKYDLRLFYIESDNDTRVKYDAEAWQECRWSPEESNPDGVPTFWIKSWVTDRQVCYSTEALKYAQGGYLVSIVCVQWSDLLICKTRNLSISQQLMINNFANFGLLFETALVALLSYIEALNIGLGTRPVASVHFAIPSFSFFAVIMFYDELRKLYLRAGWGDVTKNEFKYKGWVIRNTYY